ncbi:MAG: alanine racemase [Alphaproteobacteria bacterium]|nr:alanine racemase [Alphaproteobacteria bacterium]
MISNSLSVLRISLTNIKKNYLNLVKKVGKSVSVVPVLKSNAYGVGVERVAISLYEEGCKEFYVATLDEGIELRKILKNVRIYILFGVNKGQEYYLLKYHLTPVLNNEYQINLWLKCAKGIEEKLDACLNVDIGMTRLGIDIESFSKNLNNISDKLEIHYVLGHLSVSEDKSNDFNKKQLEVFNKLRKKFPQFKYSLSNSGGIFLGKDYHFDQVRPGIALYGTGAKNIEGMNPVITLTSEIINIFNNNNAVYVGYGCTYEAKVGTIVAAVPFGYGDGYPLALSNVGYCFINNKKVPIIGRISMDCMSINISNLDKKCQEIGQKVEIIGSNMSVADLAKLAGTIDYNVMTSLGHRYKREYV